MIVALAYDAPGPDPVSEPPTVDSRAAHLQALQIESGPIDAARLREALALRLPGVRLSSRGDPIDASSFRGDLELARVLGASHLKMTLVVSDGRAFDRTLELEDGESAEEQARVVARSAANWVVAIEAGELEPDRADVPLPVTVPCPCPEPPRVEEPSLHRESSVPAAPESAPSSAARGATYGWDLGFGLLLGTRVGLGPPRDVDRWTDWGGGVGLRVRAPRGWALGVDVATGYRSHPIGAHIVRTRVQVGGGAVWRPTAGFEVETLALLFVEPWIVRAPAVGALGRVPPALGAGARLALGYRGTASHRLAYRLGMWTSLTGAGVVTSGAAVAKISARRSNGEVPLFRIGGLELAGGMEAWLWWSVRRRP